MLKLHKPKLEDLWFKEMMLSDPETMAYNNAWGGTMAFPSEQWESWFRTWVEPGSDGFFYRYLFEDGFSEFVGEVAYHIEEGRCMADVIVYAPFRGRGYGESGLTLLLEAARENGFTEIYDDIAIDNSAILLFKKMGFVEEYRTEKTIMLRRTI